MPWEKNFDVDQALEKAGETFWAQGYEATSMQNLLDAMGIQKGSFYNAYGSKHEVYLKSLEQYSAARFEEFGELTSGRTPLEALREMFEAIYEDCISDSGFRGCMMINCALEKAYDDPKARAIVHRSISRHEGLIAELIAEGQRSGEIPESLEPSVTAKVLMSLIMGMRVYSRSGGDPASVRLLADQAVAMVDKKSGR